MMTRAKPTAIQVAVLNSGGPIPFWEQLKKETGIPMSVQRIYRWMRVNQVPPELCAAIESVSGVKKGELRPDIFDPPIEPSYKLPPLPD